MRIRYALLKIEALRHCILKIANSIGNIVHVHCEQGLTHDSSFRVRRMLHVRALVEWAQEKILR